MHTNRIFFFLTIFLVALPIFPSTASAQGSWGKIVTREAREFLPTLEKRLAENERKTSLLEDELQAVESLILWWHLRDPQETLPRKRTSHLIPKIGSESTASPSPQTSLIPKLGADEESRTPPSASELKKAEQQWRTIKNTLPRRMKRMERMKRDMEHLKELLKSDSSSPSGRSAGQGVSIPKLGSKTVSLDKDTLRNVESQLWALDTALEKDAQWLSDQMSELRGLQIDLRK